MPVTNILAYSELTALFLAVSLTESSVVILPVRKAKIRDMITTSPNALMAGANHSPTYRTTA